MENSESRPVIKVLIAAGVRLYREGLAEILDRYPDFVVVATSSCGPEAVEQVMGTLPDVVLLDMAMPEGLRTMTGCQPEGEILCV